jgi:uncharacterized membrane protein
MRLLFLITLLSLTSCQDYNSNSFDRDKYGDSELVGGQHFTLAYSVLQNRCMNCHRHSHWAEYKNQQDWVVNENLVVAGEPNQSSVIYRIINYGAGPISNMPDGGGKLPDKEYEALVKWVKEFK